MHKVYIGLDVHKAFVSIALALAGKRAPEYYGKCSGSVENLERVLRRILKRYDLKKEEVQVCYEAGPGGFVIARRLLVLGIDVIVVPPSLIPTKAGERVKTDRRDACKLARLLRAGELTSVHVPDAKDEAVRDVCRARTDAVDDVRRSKLRLGAFLLRNGFAYSGKSRWTAAHMRYLRELVLPDPAQKVVLEEYLIAIEAALERVQRLEEYMEHLLDEWERVRMVAALQGLRGFQMVSSMVINSKLGDIPRFGHPRQLMGFLGMVPGEYSSGQRRRQGSITKCGNTHARWMLIEVARHYAKAPKVNKALSVRQEGLSRAVRELSWRAQTRLHHRYVKLKLRGLNENKIIVAIARELIGFIWELAVLVKQEEGQRKAA